MFAEAVEWEARGDGFRRAGRFEEAVEAYRTALRHCFQWKWDAKACEDIREKIWCVQIECFEAFAAAPHRIVPDSSPEHPDSVELIAARLWVAGDKAGAEEVLSRAVRSGPLPGSGEFLERLAKRWESNHHDPDGAAWLRTQAKRLRGELAGSAATSGL